MTAPSAMRPPGPGLLSVLRLGNDPVHVPVELFKDFGPTVWLPTGPDFKPILLIKKPEDVEHVLVKARERYIKDRNLKWMKPILGNSILVSEGNHWRRSRRLMAPAFHRRAILSYAETMERCVARALDRIETGRPMNVTRWAMELTLEIALETLFGAQLGDRAPAIAQGLDEALEYADAAIGSFMQPPTWLPTAPVRAVKRGMKRICAVVDEVIAERRRTGVEREDLLGLLLASRDEEGDALSDEELREEVITLLLAGHETTALMVSYGLMLAGQNLATQREIVASLQETKDDEGALMRGENLVDGWMKESLRLYPPAAIIAREAVEEDDLGGYRVKVGTQVNIPIWAIHHDEQWYEEPWAFRPQRWTPDFEKSLPRFAFFPFGGGNRVCIGEAFARMEGRIVLGRVLEAFQVRALTQEAPELHLTITLRPTKPIMLIFEGRQPAT